MSITPKRLYLAREFLLRYDMNRARMQCSDIEWLMLKFACDRDEATRLMIAARSEDESS